jgi:hypothetical protein
MVGQLIVNQPLQTDRLTLWPPAEARGLASPTEAKACAIKRDLHHAQLGHEELEDTG